MKKKDNDIAILSLILKFKIRIISRNLTRENKHHPNDMNKWYDNNNNDNNNNTDDEDKSSCHNQDALHQNYSLK